VTLWVTIVTAQLQIDKIVVGQTFSMSEVSVSYHTKAFTCLEPASDSDSCRAILPAHCWRLSLMQQAYTRLGRGLSEEPMPEVRDFIVNSANLSMAGNFSINAVK
jgi:hypothetical protein